MNKEDRDYFLGQKGIAYEKDGDIENAIDAYEKLILYKFDGSLPYDRLCIIYHKRKEYASEERVLLQAIKIFTKIAQNGRGDGQPKLERYQQRLDKLLSKLKNN